MIYITGDTHGSVDWNKIFQFLSNPRNYSKGDTLIISGDFGCIWDDQITDELLSFYEPWENDITIAFVDGNHENFDMLYHYPIEEWNGGRVHRIRPNIVHLMRGEIFAIEGKTILAFGGAPSSDKQYRLNLEKEKNTKLVQQGKQPTYKVWWEQELPTASEYQNALNNLSIYNNKVDYIITHTASTDMMKYLLHWVREDTYLNHFLDDIRKNIQFKAWYFGHFHDDHLYIKDKTRLMFNVILPLGRFHTVHRCQSKSLKNHSKSDKHHQIFNIPSYKLNFYLKR